MAVSFETPFENSDMVTHLRIDVIGIPSHLDEIHLGDIEHNGKVYRRYASQEFPFGREGRFKSRVLRIVIYG
jgi:hypothetical protein